MAGPRRDGDSPGSDKFTARLAWVPTAGADRVSGKGPAVGHTRPAAALTVTDRSKGWRAGDRGPAARRDRQGRPRGAR